MKSKFLQVRKMLLVAAGLLVGASAWAQVTALPVTEDFEGETSIFTGGEIINDSKVGKVLKVKNTTATATFSPEQTLEQNEIVTFQFTAYHGWLGSGENSVFIKNSDGQNLVSYTYASDNSCQIKDVSIGGTTVTGFESFMGQSNSTNSKSANIFGHASQPFVSTENYNPIVTLSITGTGFVKFNLKYTAVNSTSIDETFSGSLPEGTKIDLGSMVMVSTANGDVFGIDNLNITKETAEFVTYTLKRVCGSEVLSEEIFSVESGSTISISQAAYYDKNNENKKYIYVSDDADGKVAEANAVYTIQYKEAEMCNYTIEATDGTTTLKTLAEASVYEGETIAIPYPRYVNYEGTLYEKAAINSIYSTSAEIKENNQKVTLVYTKTSISDVAYFSEGEDIEGANYTNEGNNMKIRSSNAACGYITEDVTLTNLSAGLYKATIVCYSNSSGGATQSFSFGDANYDAKISGASNVSTFTKTFVLSDGGNIVWLSEGSNNDNKNGLDYIYIQKLGEAVASVSVEIGATGYATFASVYPIDLDNLPEGVTAYYASEVKDETVALTKAEGQVEIGTGLILAGSANTYNIPVATLGTAIEGNLLVGCTTENKLDAKESLYVLANNSGKAEFQSLAENGATIPAGKAYLDATEAAGARTLSIVFDGETTGIAEVAAGAENGAVYNLSGQRVSKPTNGLYIVNGKKVVIK